jgi:hypothetical protein
VSAGHLPTAFARGAAAGLGFAAAVAGVLLACDAWADLRARQRPIGPPPPTMLLRAVS